MLSIGKMGSGQERYYLGKVAEGAEDYYSGEGEAAGYWLGDAAEDLGLQGKVDPDQLIGMLTGQNPASGEPLGLRHVEGGPVPGFDLTFSAPKSASLTWAPSPGTTPGLTSTPRPSGGFSRPSGNFSFSEAGSAPPSGPSTSGSGDERGGEVGFRASAHALASSRRCRGIFFARA